MRASRATGRFALCDRPVSIFTTTQLRRLTLIITRRWGTLQSNISSLVVLGHARYHRPVGWQRAARAAPLLLLGAAPASISACSRAPPPPDNHRGVDEVGATATLRLREGGTLSALSSSSSSSACARAGRWRAERMALAAAAPSALQPLRLTFGVLASPAVAA